MHGLAGEAKSYAERLFLYPGVGALDENSAAQAVEKPITDEEATDHGFLNFTVPLFAEFLRRQA